MSAATRATAPITTVTPLPQRESFRSLTSGWKIGWTMSRTTADDARIRSESTVDMMAGRTTTRNIPEKRAGKRALFITGRIVSWSASPGKRTRPAIQIVGNPDRVVPVRVCLERACHVLPGEQHAEEFSQDHTQGVEADGVPHPGEPEEQPGALARRVRAKGDDPRRELLLCDVIPGHAPRNTPSPTDRGLGARGGRRREPRR